MTYEEMIDKINAAEPYEKLAVAEACLEEYDGDDKDDIAHMILEMAMVDQDPPPPAE
ncbi:MAG: hypothetical protein AAGI72_15490 [Pseudomonadota bacterium]